MDAYEPDEFKRVPAVVWDEQININLVMVAMGYAEVYRAAPCQVSCRELEDAEAKARRDRMGICARDQVREPEGLPAAVEDSGGLNMAKAMSGKQAVPLGEVVLAQAFELEALMNVLERRGLITKAAVLEEIKQLREKAAKAR